MESTTSAKSPARSAKTAKSTKNPNSARKPSVDSTMSAGDFITAGKTIASGKPPVFTEQQFLGMEGRDLLAALDTTKLAPDKLQLPPWTSGRMRSQKPDNKFATDPLVNSAGLEFETFKPYLLPLGDDLENKLQKWSERQRYKVGNLMHMAYLVCVLVLKLFCRTILVIVSD